jgi:hypothetical protein
LIEDVISEIEDWACFRPEKPQKLDNRRINPDEFTSSSPKIGKNQAKKKRKMQEQSRRKNRSKKK